MIKNPPMVYKLYQQCDSYADERFAGPHNTKIDVLTEVSVDPEDIFEAMDLNKYYKITYVVDDGQRPTRE